MTNAIVPYQSRLPVKWQPQVNNIYHMDALQLLEHLPDASVDLIVTDPPYGINRDKGVGSGGGGIIPRNNIRHYQGNWDNSRPPKIIFDLMVKKAKHVIVFGGNYFSDYLPQCNHWVVWDKLVTMPSYSKCELIWTNFDNNTVQKITREMNGMIGGIRNRKHPTQKPVDLIAELLVRYSNDGELILDPFMGSGSTAVAAKKLNRQFIGCDISAEYVKIARDRVRDTDPYQPTLLPDGSKQLSLFQTSA